MVLGVLRPVALALQSLGEGPLRVLWARGGPNNLPNMVLVCNFHHRLVHEGGWQVIKSGREFNFLPPERVVMRWARGSGYRWAA
jgi:hypothetical protein